MPILTTDIIFKLSGGGSNTDGSASLGGAISSTTVSGSLNAFWDVVSGAESNAGDIEYRCFYVKNTHATLTLYDTYVWISSNTPSIHTAVDIAVGTSAINGTEQTIADESTSPTGVSFSSPATYGAGLLLGDIPAGEWKAVWVRRTITAGAAAYAADTATISVQGDTPA